MSDIVRGAMLRLNLLDITGNMSAEESNLGLGALNDLFTDLTADGILSYPADSGNYAGEGDFINGVMVLDVLPQVGTPITAGPYLITDTFPLLAQFVGALKAMLAERLLEDFGRSPSDYPVLMRDAKRGRAALYAFYIVAPPADFDQGIAVVPSQRRYGVLS